MKLSMSTQRALTTWLGSDTWYKNHHFDDLRFYRFVHQYIADHGVNSFTGDELFAEITAFPGIDWNEPEFLSCAKEKANIMDNIIEFIRAA
ncbi:hypothetical protein [Plesiomonas shigelloides]|uniref:hypothetical protein n=1 Tax=Plesiomonas shigelloides TaxID=703 RepID=UPI001261D3B2|nr:hypothetical protein [Plesiomonas shigelloides]KAB7693115.1 hypothetical protein GBN28_01430 [Plesiomonas shigelloides]